MDKLKGFLIKRLIMVMIIVVAVEMLLGSILNYILFPFIWYLMGKPGASDLSVSSILGVFWGIITGNNAYVYNALETSAVIALILFSLLLITIPIVAGIMIYAGLVTKQVEQLELEREKERKSYESKRNLMLSDFAHDLRTPIMTIGGYASAITDGMVKDDAQEKEYLEAIAAKSKRMTEL